MADANGIPTTEAEMAAAAEAALNDLAATRDTSTNETPAINLGDATLTPGEDTIGRPIAVNADGKSESDLDLVRAALAANIEQDTPKHNPVLADAQQHRGNQQQQDEGLLQRDQARYRELSNPSLSAGMAQEAFTALESEKRQLRKGLIAEMGVGAFTRMEQENASSLTIAEVKKTQQASVTPAEMSAWLDDNLIVPEVTKTQPTVKAPDQASLYAADMATRNRSDAPKSLFDKQAPAVELYSEKQLALDINLMRNIETDYRVASYQMRVAQADKNLDLARDYGKLARSLAQQGADLRVDMDAAYPSQKDTIGSANVAHMQKLDEMYNDPAVAKAVEDQFLRRQAPNITPSMYVNFNVISQERDQQTYQTLQSEVPTPAKAPKLTLAERLDALGDRIDAKATASVEAHTERSESAMQVKVVRDARLGCVSIGPRKMEMEHTIHSRIEQGLAWVAQAKGDLLSTIAKVTAQEINQVNAIESSIVSSVGDSFKAAGVVIGRRKDEMSASIRETASQMAAEVKDAVSFNNDRGIQAMRQIGAGANKGREHMNQEVASMIKDMGLTQNAQAPSVPATQVRPAPAGRAR